MFGLILGTLCLFGLAGMARRAAWRHAYAYGGGFGPYGGGCHHGGHHGRFGGGWGPYGRRGGRRATPEGREAFVRAAGEVFKRRLRIDEEQEPVVDHALADLKQALESFTTDLKETRQGLADAFRGETVDDGALSALFARHDDAFARARREVVSTLKQVHAVLDADQRKQAADLLAAGKEKWL